MKRSLSDPELTLPEDQKRQKQSEQLFLKMVQILNDSTILDRILVLWILNRNETYTAICEKEGEDDTYRDPYDWLGVQVVSAFCRENPPWKNLAYARIDYDLDSWIDVAVPKAKFLRYTVLTHHQRKWYDSIFPENFAFQHIGYIVEKYQLHKVIPKKCGLDCSEKVWRGGCDHVNYTIVRFAMDNMNLPLWRRILDTIHASCVPLATILKEIEKRAKQQSPVSDKFKFLDALCEKTVKLPLPLYQLAKHFYECIIKKAKIFHKEEFEEEYIRFCRALSILFEERDLDFNFWQSGNLVFVQMDNAY